MKFIPAGERTRFNNKLRLGKQRILPKVVGRKSGKAHY